MRNEFTKQTVEWVGVIGGAMLAHGYDCSLPAPFITTDRSPCIVT